MPNQTKSKIKTRRSTRLNSSRNNDQSNNDQNANVTNSGNGNLKEDQGVIQVNTDDADLEEENLNNENEELDIERENQEDQDLSKTGSRDVCIGTENLDNSNEEEESESSFKNNSKLQSTSDKSKENNLGNEDNSSSSEKENQFCRTVILKCEGETEYQINLNSLHTFVSRLGDKPSRREEALEDLSVTACRRHVKAIIPSLSVISKYDKRRLHPILKELMIKYFDNEDLRITIPKSHTEDTIEIEKIQQLIDDKHKELIDITFKLSSGLRNGTMSCNLVENKVKEVELLNKEISSLEGKRDALQDKTRSQSLLRKLDEISSLAAKRASKNRSESDISKMSNRPLSKVQNTRNLSKKVSFSENNNFSWDNSKSLLTGLGLSAAERASRHLSQLNSWTEDLDDSLPEVSNTRYSLMSSSLPSSFEDRSSLNNYNLDERHRSSVYEFESTRQYQEKLMLKSLLVTKFDNIYDGKQNLFLWFEQFDRWCDNKDLSNNIRLQHLRSYAINSEQRQLFGEEFAYATDYLSIKQYLLRNATKFPFKELEKRKRFALTFKQLNCQPIEAYRKWKRNVDLMIYLYESAMFCGYNIDEEPRPTEAALVLSFINGLWGKTEFFVNDFMVIRKKTFKNLLQSINIANQRLVNIRGFNNNFYSNQSRINSKGNNEQIQEQHPKNQKTQESSY